MIDIRILGVGKYCLLTDIHVEAREWNISIKSGFVWDGASIPRNLWEEVGCPLDYAIESCVHDALYRSRLLDRKTSDKIFHNLLLQSNVDSFKAKIMYLAVRVGGEQAYNDARHMMAHYRDYVSVLPKTLV